MIKTRALECRAIMEHASTKANPIDANVIEDTKVQRAIDKSIYARISFATTEAFVLSNRTISQRANVHKVTEDRIVTNRMVCPYRSCARVFECIEILTRRVFACYCWYVEMDKRKREWERYFFHTIYSTDACDNINCNFGRCLIHQHDGAPYCDCLSGYTGVLCLDEIRADDFCE